MEKPSRKKSLGRRSSLPVPPPEPTSPHPSPSSSSHSATQPSTPSQKTPPDNTPDAIRSLMGYREREKSFLKALNEHCDEKPCETNETECENYIKPLLNTTGPSVVAALATHDAFEQLNKLHSMLYQFLTIKEQNDRMRRNARDLEMINGLKKIQMQMASQDPATLTDDLSDTEALEAEIAQNEKLWDTILAAGQSATNKRLNSKRNRSKSIITEEMDFGLPNLVYKDNKPYPLRRQSAITDIKAKVSKWTKVKAAFKWERANAATFHEGKSTDSGIGLAPVNHEIARYLKVPTIQCAGSSGDSVMSSSSGLMFSGGSMPPTPGTMSSASSTDDMFHLSEDIHDHKHNRNHDTSSTIYQESSDTNRRSHSLDGDLVLGPCPMPSCTEKMHNNRTTWGKVKNIIQTHRPGSFKGKPRTRSVKSLGSIGGSQDASPYDSNDGLFFSETFESNSSSQTSPIIKSVTPALTLTAAPIMEIPTVPNSPISLAPLSLSSDDYERSDYYHHHGDAGSHRRGGSEKSAAHKSKMKHHQDHHHQVELRNNSTGVAVKSRRAQPHQSAESSDEKFHSVDSLQRHGSKWSKVKRALLATSSAGPSSPIRNAEFFGDSEELSSGDFSEPTSPHRKTHPYEIPRTEIEKDYVELQKKLNLEFERKQIEFEKIRAFTSVPGSMGADKGLKDDNKTGAGQPIKEDNLPPDFKKKLHEWRAKKSMSAIKEGQTVTNFGPKASSPVPANQKIDWQLWKTGQIKLEGQGLIQLPDEKDLPEDFQKKLDEWKRKKSGGNMKCASQESVFKRQSSGKDTPVQGKKFDFEKELLKKRERRDKKIEDRDKLEKLKIKKPPAKEVTVQTTEGVLKFEGISRKFTRKLYEWEKSRGIGPESSTFALLHPGYRPIAVGEIGFRKIGNKEHREKSPGISRSFSMDSISPIASLPSMSHHTSSLSLNDADDLKETSSITTDRRVSSNPELEIEDVHDEPEAVIVEVEDDIIETAAPLMNIAPQFESQNAVYMYERVGKEICVPEPKNSFFKTSHEENKTIRVLKRSLAVLANNERTSSDGVGTERDLKSLQPKIMQVFENLNSIPIHKRRINAKRYDMTKEACNDIMKQLKMSKNDKQIWARVSELKTGIHKYIQELSEVYVQEEESDVPSISITPAASTSSSRDFSSSPRVSVTTHEAMKNLVRVHQVKIMDDSKMDEPKSATVEEVSTSEQTKTQDNASPTISTSRKSLNDDSPDAVSTGAIKKVVRTSSNGTKRKVKIRRMGSRQNSKTETESDEETPNFVLDTPRKCKRKTSRAKKVSEKDAEKPQTDEKQDDIVYVLKIKQSPVLSGVRTMPGDRSVLISPTESCVELFESAKSSQENLPPSASCDIFVKTHRKLFSPVETESGVPSNAVFEQAIESPVTPTQKLFPTEDNTDDNKKKIMNLPPLPQSSPTFMRKINDAQRNQITKELSPSIQFMIAKYNKRLSAERSNSSPVSSGSCSPVAWRSPFLERRVRAQTLKYEEKYGITKSSSAGHLNQSTGDGGEVEKSHSCRENDRVVKKSHSAGAIEMPTFKIVNILNSSKPPVDLTRNDSQQKKERHYKKHTDTHPSVAQKSGAIRKIAAMNQRDDPLYRRRLSSESSQPDPSDNVQPRITRKYEKRMPVPLTIYSNESISIDSIHLSAPTTPELLPSNPITPVSERALKILKAKEEFFASSKAMKKDAVWNNRLSQISVESESSLSDCAALMKSASVGVIGSQSAPEASPVTLSGYTSLPRNTKPPTEEDTSMPSAKTSKSKFGFSNIASKLRKVKLRKSSKELGKMTAVSTLCRQSLMVEVQPRTNSDEESCGGDTRKNSIESPQSAASTSSSGIFRFHRRHENKEKLKKSKSVGSTVVLLKESHL